MGNDTNNSLDKTVCMETVVPNLTSDNFNIMIDSNKKDEVVSLSHQEQDQ